jgi:uncharacterized coiled-coil protein SlyX
MNNNSNPFPTVVFLVFLFIGTGLLLYHSVDQAQRINELITEAATRQAELDSTITARDEALQKVASLETTITALNAIIADLQASKSNDEEQIAQLINKVETLQAELDKANAVIATLTPPGDGVPSGTTTDLTTLPPCTCEDTIGAIEPSQPKPMITFPGFWNLVAGLSLGEIAVIGGITIHRQHSRQQKIFPRLTTTMRSGHSLPGKDGSNMIDSRFIDR